MAVMRFDKFTFKAQESIQQAQKLAEEHQHQTIDVEHLLLALVEQAEGVVQPVLRKMGTNPSQVAQRLKEELRRLPQVSGVPEGQTHITSRLEKILNAALSEAERLKDEYVSTEHLLLAIAEERGGAVGRLLRELGVTKDGIYAALQEIRGGQRVTDQAPEEKYQALERYARGFLVDIPQQIGADLAQARFGITHGRRAVAVDRAEVAVALYERIARGEVLRHAHHCVVNRAVAVGMVLAHAVADDTRGLTDRVCRAAARAPPWSRGCAYARA